MSNWYVLYVRPLTEDGKPQKISFPLVGTRIAHFLAQSDDQEKNDKDMKNPLWKIIQDEARPAWAPDLYRLGYAVVFKREGLPKIAVSLGIRNPDNLKKEGKTANSSDKRTLTFDDVWVVGVNPTYMPMGMPSTEMRPEDWWLTTSQVSGIASPYITPGGAEVVVGAQRLSDVVASMLHTAEGYPRTVPGLQDQGPEALSEFVNPRLPILPVVRDEPNQPGNGGQVDRYATTPLFRY